jgi:4-hydroxy-3-methylbut-2-enyl diphosphate reductase
MNTLKLKVEINYKSGFCFGVISAIAKAEKALTENKEIYCLGEIVHNEEENKRLSEKGMITIRKEQLSGMYYKKILFRAHGEPPSSYEKAYLNNNEVIDASCPIILKLQERVKKTYNKGENIYIFGKQNHPEVIAINGQINNNAVVFEKLEDLNINEMPKKITLYSQTTKSLEEFYFIIKMLQEAGIDVTVNDTVCRQVSNRQEDLIKFSKQFDQIIFVAGKHSSNGKVLYNVCKSTNPNTYFVSTAGEIDKDLFHPNEKIGIYGATSTPLWLMEQIKQTLESF